MSRTPISRASAAIWVRAVQVPVPMSVAPISTAYRPFSWNVILAFEPGNLKTGYVALATPVPTSQRPSRLERGVGSRSAHPKRSAPSRRQATRLRLE
jgi:hypothetical protein